MRLSRLGALWLNVVWTYGVGTTIIDEIDDKRLTDANLTANVALDMFLDPDLAKSSSTTAPSFEIMVWFGAFGNVKPIGFSDTPINEREVNGTKL
jgi:xyloglucan-specific endo-beta-1,4-glucanase